MFVFAASRRPQPYRDRQVRHAWKDHDRQELRDATIVVYGMGSIGTEVARLASAVGMRVIGVRRRAAPQEGASRGGAPPGAGRLGAGAELPPNPAPPPPPTPRAASAPGLPPLETPALDRE